MLKSIALASVTAIIVNYETGEETRRVVGELDELGIEAVVVDNEGDDELLTWGETRANLEYVRTEENRGYTGGNNVGIERARKRSDYVLLVNPDVHFPESFDIENFVDPMTRDNQLKLMAPTVVNDAGESLHDPSPRLMKLFAAWNLLPEIPESDPVSPVRPTYAAPGSCLLVAADLFADCVIFDERFFLYREEVELCMRTLQAGYRVGIHTEERIAHEEPNGLRHSVDYQMYYNVRNWFPLVKNRFSGWERPVAYSIVALSVLSQVLKVASARQPELLYPLALGVFDGVRGRYGRQRYLTGDADP